MAPVDLASLTERLARTDPSAVLPHGWASALIRAVELVDQATAEQFLWHNLDWAPATRREVHASPWLDRRLDPSRLPGTAAAVDRLAATLSAVGLSCPTLSGQTWRDLLDQTYFGGLFAPLYGQVADLAALTDDELDARLAGPLAHELAHLHRDKALLLPPPLDEAIAGWLTAQAAPHVLWPDPGDDNGIAGGHWCVQVGQALVRGYGRDRVLRCHAGLESLPLVDRAWRVWEAQLQASRAPHLLGNLDEPMAWVALVDEDAQAIQDAEIVRDGLRAMCTAAHVHRGTHRMKRALPDAPIVVDGPRRRITRPLLGDESGRPPMWWLPSTVAKRWQEPGLVMLDDVDAIDEVVAAVVAGRRGDGLGYAIG